MDKTDKFIKDLIDKYGKTLKLNDELKKQNEELNSNNVKMEILLRMMYKENINLENNFSVTYCPLIKILLEKIKQKPIHEILNGT